MDSDNKYRSTRGAIFSSDSENTVMSTGKFSNDRPQQQSNQIISPVPVSSGMGDIVLNGGKKPKKRIWIFVTLLVVAVALIGALVWMLTWGKADKIPVSDVEKAFYKYANYISFQVDSDEKATMDYEDIYSSALYQVITEGDLEATTAFLDESEKRLNDFVAVAENTTSNNVLFDMLIVAAPAQLEALRTYCLSSGYNSAMMINDGFEQGSNAMLKNIKASYAQLSQNENTILIAIAESQIALAESVANFVRFYENAGCVIDGEIDENCAEKVGQSSEMIEKYDEITAKELEVRLLEEQLIRNVLGNCESILDTIGTKDSNESEAEE